MIKSITLYLIDKVNYMDNSPNLDQQLFSVLDAYKSALQSALAVELPQISLLYYRVLRLLGRAEPVTPLQVAQLLRRDKAQVTRLIADLAAKNWLIKQPHPQDKRSVQLALTPVGEQLLTQAKALEQRLSQRMLQGMDTTQQQQLAAGLQLLQRNLQQVGD